MILKFLNKVDTKKLFVESDAWWLFKYAALSEVVGWTLLIYGILADKYLLPGHIFALPIGGSVHGMLFLAYIGVLAATYSSLGWTRKRALMGLLVSPLPYGTLFFEQWASRERIRATRGSYRRLMVRAIVANKGLLLAFQPSNSVTWRLPGGYIGGGELAADAIVRILKELTGVTAVVGALVDVHQPKSRDKAGGDFELYFEIANAKDFSMIDLQKIANRHGEIDELRFLDPRTTNHIGPAFLRSKQ